jgi:hypothetical protein
VGSLFCQSRAVGARVWGQREKVPVSRGLAGEIWITALLDMLRGPSTSTFSEGGGCGAAACNFRD